MTTRERGDAVERACFDLPLSRGMWDRIKNEIHSQINMAVTEERSANLIRNPSKDAHAIPPEVASPSPETA